MWIARDKDGMLCIYATEPERTKIAFCVPFDSKKSEWFELHEEEFPEVTWENSPIEIRSLKVVKD
ncbi:MAG: hypothetical protein IJ748_02135 [Bacteroidales bacterium]|nr:hypothetical protein [Bacteroidales bacterium]